MKAKLLVWICVILAHLLLIDSSDWKAHCNHSTLPVLPSEAAIALAVRKLDTQVWVNARQHGYKAHQIPLNIWVTVKEVPVHVPPHHFQMLQNNTNFKYLVVSDADADLFMNEVFYNTSYLWAYHSMNKKLGAGKADIFRYAVMYVFGGTYVDSDASWTGNLEQYLRPQDGFLVGTEPYPVRFRPCYQSSFSLGSGNFSNKEFVKKLPWDDFVTAQYMLVSRPRHQFISRAMGNLVDIFRHLKCLRDKDLFAKTMKKEFMLLCSTGPDMLSASIRSCLYETHPSSWTSTFGARYSGEYYSDVGGLNRALPGSEVQSSTHWTKIVTDQGASLFDET